MDGFDITKGARMNKLEEKVNKSNVIILIGFIALIVLGLYGLIKLSSYQPASVAYSTEPDALTKMQAVFEGNYSRAEIKNKLDSVMFLYGVPITETNYKKYGSGLCYASDKSGYREMDILDAMLKVDKTSLALDKDEDEDFLKAMKRALLKLGIQKSREMGELP